MYYARFWRGVNPLRTTRSPRIWLGYLAWWLCRNLEQLPPMPSAKLYRWADRRFPRYLAHIAYNGPDTTVTIRRGEKRNDSSLVCTLMHLGFLAARDGLHRRLGPLRKLIGSNDARCDWTARDGGLLYGGKGGITAEMFGWFLRRIEPKPETKAAIREATEQLDTALRFGGEDGEVN